MKDTLLVCPSSTAMRFKVETSHIIIESEDAVAKCLPLGANLQHST